ncbi:MAG: AbrB/MazE/SpoVT family DNA-binding domain-containing protein [Chloroflexi bacterium]|nr:AbrB/MazE/SpoVT family DNA-binding domain-containing protein [Chloroflexota bacterium]MYC48196.1 AbrB/MazE/SpoVT family DNA-binding domain-containing protein [Chloroflexota bacterium]
MNILKELIMGVKSHVSKWGSSLAIRIPKAVAEQWGVGEGSAIEIDPKGEELHLRKRNFDLNDLIKEMSRNRQHPEEEWGPPLGEEEW